MNKLALLLVGSLELCGNKSELAAEVGASVRQETTRASNVEAEGDSAERGQNRPDDSTRGSAERPPRGDESRAVLRPNTVRLLAITEEPLASERRATERTKRALDGAALRTDLVWANPSEPEASAALGWFSDSVPSTALPSTWQSYEQVVVVRGAPPRRLRNGRRASQSISGLAVFRPPSRTPVITVVGDEAAGWVNGGEAYSVRPFNAWLLELLRASPAPGKTL